MSSQSRNERREAVLPVETHSYARPPRATEAYVSHDPPVDPGKEGRIFWAMGGGARGLKLETGVTGRDESAGLE
jgi:hypothetical protein